MLGPVTSRAAACSQPVGVPARALVHPPCTKPDRACCVLPLQGLADCTGHFGYIKLELPVFHIGYFKNTLQILQAICKTCSRVLATGEERRRTLRQGQRGTAACVDAGCEGARVVDQCRTDVEVDIRGSKMGHKGA